MIAFRKGMVSGSLNRCYLRQGRIVLYQDPLFTCIVSTKLLASVYAAMLCKVFQCGPLDDDDM
jgi:hypothetical protein